MNTFKNSHIIAKILAFLMLAGALINLYASHTMSVQLEILNNMAIGIEYSDEAIDASDSAVTISGLFQMVTYFICAVFISIWTYRTVYNAKVMSLDPLPIGPGLAVGSYFIPILNLWKPVQAISAARKVFITAGGNNPGGGYFIPLWWTAWLVSNVLGQASFRMSNFGEDIDEIIAYTRVTMYSDTVDVLLYLVTLAMILHISGLNRWAAKSLEDGMSTADAQ